MATLSVKVTRAAGLQGFSVRIDGGNVPIGPDDKGTKEVAGACGDRSVHRVSYEFFGPAGTKFGLSIKCGESEVFSLATEVPEDTAPNAADYEDFEL